jgi:hypothetical protein
LRHKQEPSSLHLNVALMECDSEASLEEALLLLRDLSLHLHRVNLHTVAFPARELPLIRRALEARQCYPRVIGEPTPNPPPEEPS